MIQIRNLSKSYRLKGGRNHVFRDVTTEFPEDVNIGIIGPNGAGKSTFLRILGGIDFPDSGEIISDKTFSWPLGLRGGFVRNMTGRANSRMVCNIYGLHPRDTRKKLEQIKELTGIGEYFEEPVKYYSSGMGGRLGFALSMAFDFDYFLMDEITAVGDAHFKTLAKQALAEKAQKSRVIMVTHSMGDLKKFCDMGVLIKDGKFKVFTDLDEAIRSYLPQTEESEADLSDVLQESSFSDTGLNQIRLPAALKKCIKEIQHHLESIEMKLASPARDIEGDEDQFYSKLAVAYHKLGNIERAEELHREAAELNSFRLHSQQKLIAIAARRHNSEEESDRLELAEQADPMNLTTARARIEYLVRQNRLDEALAKTEDALKVNPGHFGLWSQRAKILELMGRLPEALSAQVKAVKCSPKNATLYRTLSRLLVENNRIEESVRARYQAFKLSRPRDPSKSYHSIRDDLKELEDRISV